MSTSVEVEQVDRNNRRTWIYFLVGAVVYSLVAVFQTSPGYMDADYYTSTAIQIADGKGFQEPFIWNYLNQPAGIPTDSHLYWMPLASILAALGRIIGWGEDFLSIRLPFVLIAAVLAPIALTIADGLVREAKHAWMGGMLAAFAGLYWIYLTLPETFGLYMLLGAGLISMVGGNNWLRIDVKSLIFPGITVGILCGLMHLTRADGILWLAGSLVWIGYEWLSHRRSKENPSIFRIAIILLTILFGYSLLTGAWYLRNIDLFGSLMPPGNSRLLWLTDYNQTYQFDLESINFNNWVDSGIHSILISRWQGLKMNLANLLVVQGGIVFLPLTLLGLWKLRTDARIRFLVFMWIITLTVMTVVFPFAGARGGYLHSGAAFQLYIWALVPVGLERVVDWGALKRGWNPNRANNIFSISLVVIAAIISGFLYINRVLGPNPAEPLWGQSERVYRMVGKALDDLGISADEIAAVNNPPGWYLATGRSSIVIPNGGLDSLLAAARRYGATFLILESNQENLAELYANPGDREGLNYIAAVGGVQIYRITSNE